VSAAPYFQKKTLRKEACQVDLLIHTRYAAYICEIKYQSRIGSRVIKDINEKIIKLKLPKNLSVRPVLIYMGELSEKVKVSNIFNQYLPFEHILTHLQNFGIVQRRYQSVIGRTVKVFDSIESVTLNREVKH
jgi:hypothetical protein